MIRHLSLVGRDVGTAWINPLPQLRSGQFRALPGLFWKTSQKDRPVDKGLQAPLETAYAIESFVVAKLHNQLGSHFGDLQAEMMHRTHCVEEIIVQSLQNPASDPIARSTLCSRLVPLSPPEGYCSAAFASAF